MNILLLAHDLSDPTIARRVAMLKAGDATVTLAGFRRSETRIDNIHGCPALDLGRTYNAAFAKRIFSVLRAIFTAHRWGSSFAGTCIILARNLEMLAVAIRLQKLLPSKPIVVYEMLDIHRLLLKKNIIGVLMRAVEARLIRSCAGIITSSPAFIDHYFRRFHPSIGIPIRLMENKLLDIDNRLSAPNLKRPQGPPWKIGWFGILRCRQSLLLLQELVQKSGGRVEVILRGRPALNEMPDFHDIVAATPGMRFLGPYGNPDNLASIYGEVHFAWAIDLFEAGLNSSWLLPNRIYEGGFYEAIPLAMDDVETGHFLRRLNTGVTLKQPLSAHLIHFFATLVPDLYDTLTQSMVNVPRSVWVYDRDDCRAFVGWLYDLQQFERMVNA